MDKRLGLLVALLFSVGTVQAELSVAEQPLNDAELAELRGGFVLDGLEIAIGLEQIVAVNGETLVINRLNIPNLNQVVNSDRLLSQMESVLSVQGAGSEGLALASGAVGDSGWMTVIQNSLNSSTIQQIRQLNIELNNFGGAYRLPRDFGLPLLP